MVIELVGIAVLTLCILLTTTPLTQAAKADWKTKLQKLAATKQFESAVDVAHLTKGQRFKRKVNKRFPPLA